MKSRIRIVTYNVHKCRGMDRRISAARIAEVLREVDADVIALQEILRVTNDDPKQDQIGFIASCLGWSIARSDTIVPYKVARMGTQR